MFTKYSLSFFCLLLLVSTVQAQHKIENVIIITSDGLRWQEVFKGIDTAIVNNKRFAEGDSSGIYKKYWAAEPQESRKKIFPFLWNTFEKQGQLYGNRLLGTKVNVANPYWYSYAGYSELFCGFADPEVKSNNHPDNTNSNLLGFLQQMPQYRNKVAIFAAWSAFNRILNEKVSELPVIAAFDLTGAGRPNEKEQLLNQMLTSSYKPWGQDECLDVFTHYQAMEHLKKDQPKVLYIAYGETDEWAHAGKYKSYLNAARQVDQWIEEIWAYVQSQPKYKDKTALVLTVDHGRGEKARWTSHGDGLAGSDQTWFGILAPGLKNKGEVKENIQLYQQQLAQSIAALLGVRFTAAHPVAEKVEQIWK